MKYINLDHWFIKENVLNISLMRFYVSIETNIKNGKLCYILRVINSNREKLVFDFSSLEDAVMFTEDIVNSSKDLQEVINRYKGYFKNNQDENIEENTEKITLTPDEVEEAIISYFGDGKDYRVSVDERLFIENDLPKIYYYLVEHTEYNEIYDDNRILLTDGDIANALDDYVSFYNYKLIDFKYKCEIQKTGYYYEEDTANYYGIELSVKKLDKKLVLK